MTRVLYICDNGSHWTSNWWLNYDVAGFGKTQSFNIHKTFKETITYCRAHHRAYNFFPGEFITYITSNGNENQVIDIFDDAEVAIFLLSNL